MNVEKGVAGDHNSKPCPGVPLTLISSVMYLHPHLMQRSWSATVARSATAARTGGVRVNGSV
jgi:hypothetical protein